MFFHVLSFSCESLLNSRCFLMPLVVMTCSIMFLLAREAICVAVITKRPACLACPAPSPRLSSQADREMVGMCRTNRKDLGYSSKADRTTSCQAASVTKKSSTQPPQAVWMLVVSSGLGLPWGPSLADQQLLRKGDTAKAKLHT